MDERPHPLPALTPYILRRYARHAHEIVRAAPWPVVLANTLFLTLLVVVHLAALRLVFRIAFDRDEQNITLTLLTLPITAYLLVGLLRFYLQLVRTGTAAPRLLLIGPFGFSGGARAYLHLLLFCGIYYFLYVVLLKVLLDIGDYNMVIRIRMVAGLLLFFWLVARLVFAPLYIVDQGANIRTGLRSSFLLTSGRTWRTLFLCLSFALVLALGFLALFVGAVYTVAIVQCAYVLAFDIYRAAPGSRLASIEMPENAPPAPPKRARRARAPKKPVPEEPQAPA